MKESELIQELLQIGEEEEGFLVQLHVRLNFNEREYRRLFDLFSEYEQIIHQNDVINRRVARLAVDIESTLGDAAYHFEQRGREDSRRVRDAHAEFLDLLYKLLP